MRVADQVRDYVRRLHPDQRRTIKAALHALAAGGSSDSLPLADDLEGFYRLRVGKFRIVYRFLDNGEISCEFMDVRATVYERFATMRETIESSWSLNEPSGAYGRPGKRKIQRKRKTRAS